MFVSKTHPKTSFQITVKLFIVNRTQLDGNPTDVSFLCICPLIDVKFCHYIVKVCCQLALCMETSVGNAVTPRTCSINQKGAH